MTSFDAIDTHVRNAIVGGSAGAVLGSGGGVVISTCAACACSLLMVILGHKKAMTPPSIEPRPGI